MPTVTQLPCGQSSSDSYVGEKGSDVTAHIVCEDK